MMSQSSPSPFYNVEISVSPDPDNVGEYIVNAKPELPIITVADSIINYKIVDSGGSNIVFTGMTVTPHNNGQLSSAIVSVDGKMLTLSDINTVEMTFNVTLQFKDNDHTGRQFAHDPQVQNRPPP